jgi:hypothetical protein|eukprot:evm.model.NODE_10964_length_10690_cov_28.192797.2
MEAKVDSIRIPAAALMKRRKKKHRKKKKLADDEGALWVPMVAVPQQRQPFQAWSPKGCG